jgi:hypothetical protein
MCRTVMTRLTAHPARNLDSGTELVMAGGLVEDARYAFVQVPHPFSRASSLRGISYSFDSIIKRKVRRAQR